MIPCRRHFRGHIARHDVDSQAPDVPFRIHQGTEPIVHFQLSERDQNLQERPKPLAARRVSPRRSAQPEPRRRNEPTAIGDSLGDRDARLETLGFRQGSPKMTHDITNVLAQPPDEVSTRLMLTLNELAVKPVILKANASDMFGVAVSAAEQDTC